MLWFVGSIWTCSSHPTKAEYGGPRYRCERGVKRPSRESLGATLVSMAKRLAEQHFVVFLACVASVSVRFRRKERGTRVKDREKSGASKRAGRGWGRKEGNACRQTPGFWKPPTWPRHAWVRAPTFDAVINCHNWPIKCLAFRGAEMNFRGRVCETKINFIFVFWSAWTAVMVKSQWIRTINAGFVHLSSQSV